MAEQTVTNEPAKIEIKALGLVLDALVAPGLTLGEAKDLRGRLCEILARPERAARRNEAVCSRG